MDTVIGVQIQDKVVCILHNDNIIGRDMNLTILPPVMSKLLGMLGSLTLLWQPVQDRENSKLLNST